MENQRRRFEKEKEDAFRIWRIIAFAKEALNMIDNFRSIKTCSLENDDKIQKKLKR